MTLAFLISDGSRPESLDLESSLADSFHLERVSPIFCSLQDLEDNAVVDRSAFIARHLREPTKGEVGCALAHRSVYHRFLESGETWCLVFEDDAKVVNAQAFRHRLKHYRTICMGPSPAIININEGAEPQGITRKVEGIAGLRRCFVTAYPATAYAINLNAARLLLERQTPVRSQADWPVTAADLLFYLDTQSGVIENRQLASTIDSEGQRIAISRLRKLQSWTAFWFLRNARHFNGLSDYWNKILKPRVFWHINRALYQESS